MNIVHVTPRPPYSGGVETLAAEICKSLAERGNSVTLYCLKRGQSEPVKETIIGSVKVKQFKLTIDDPFYLPSRRLSSELRNEPADIIEIHNINTLLPFAVPFLVRFPSARMVLHSHYHELPQMRLRTPFFYLYRTMMNRFMPERYDVVVVNSRYEEYTLRRDFPNFAGMTRLVPEEYSLEIPQGFRWNPSKQPRRILYVGVLTKYKNVDVLVRAFRMLSSKTRDVGLTIIGSGPEKENLLKLASDLGIKDRITWKRSVPSIFEEYAKASVVTLLSQLESFSRVAHEGIALGVPLVLYNYGALRPLVARGEARGVDILTSGDVADALRDCLDGTWTPPRPKMPRTKESYIDLIMQIYKELKNERA